MSLPFSSLKKKIQMDVFSHKRGSLFRLNNLEQQKFAF